MYAQWATRELRRRLRVLGIPGADMHSLRGFRRGRALDVVRAGGRLVDVLHAGDWSSTAFCQVLGL